ncbi:DDE superfamily endonuclease [Nitzschia inconspicua]|uniref:DDE superfamily endonuclease n=1 Tax=Nitzschia inconspicua TaxID=303405 RepID=A0A9K3LM02_9STRA|nr:DDE superfamily endonuclease [Nitzschia inconspicua]
MARKRYNIGQKLKLLDEFETLRQQGYSRRKAAASLGVQPIQIRKWTHNRPVMQQCPRKKKSICKGRLSALKHLEQPLIGWCLDQRAEGIPVTYALLQIRAGQLDEEFRQRPEKSQYHMIRALCRANEIVLRCVTHQSQRRPQDVADEALEFLVVERPIVGAPGVNLDVVLNMDQTPVFLSMQPKRTLNLRGETTVNGRKTSNSTNRVTASLAVSASGLKLKPMLIFKGTPNGHIARRELPALPQRNELVMVCQEAAWQDDNNMAKWIDLCLVPYLQEYGQGAAAILYLDAFTAHFSASTKAKLETQGVQLRAIPPGCTGLVQPIDVGVGKPFKDRVRQKWIEWMMRQDAEAPVMTNASRADCAAWVAESWRNLPQSILKNSWRKSGFSWFPADVDDSEDADAEIADVDFADAEDAEVADVPDVADAAE